jgi:hypothetical protein
MNQAVVEELQRIGVTHKQAESIASDLAGFDARSLLSELLVRGLWSLVIDETNLSQLPKVGGDTVQRLLNKGIDPDDLIDVIREAQVDIIYNVAQLIDWPTSETRLEEVPDLTISVSIQESGTSAFPIYELHSCLLERDPSGRHGEPRTIEVRQFQKLREDEQRHIVSLLREQKFSGAALFWKSSVGGELKDCLTAVQRLRKQLRYADA